MPTRLGNTGERESLKLGTNHHSGLKLYYYLKEAPSEKDTLTITFFEADGDSIKTFSSHDKENKVEVKKGSNNFLWDLRYKDAEGFDGLIMWSGNLKGPKAAPGSYQVSVSLNGISKSADFKVLSDPRSPSSEEDLIAQFNFLVEVRDKLTTTHSTIKDIRSAREQMTSLKTKLKDAEVHKNLIALIDTTSKKMQEIEEALYQTKNKSGQDPLNFPIKLNDKLSGVANVTKWGAWKPTDQAVAVKNELFDLIDKEIQRWEDLKKNQIKEINQLVLQGKVDAIFLE